MNEKAMLLDLKQVMVYHLEQLEDQIILSDPRDDDAAYSFLIKKAATYRDTLKKIDERLKEL